MSQSYGKKHQHRGGQPPRPRDLALCSRNSSAYNECARAEDKATQGCDLSADSSAETAGRLRPPQNPTDKFTYRFLYKFEGHFGLDNGVHLSLLHYCISLPIRYVHMYVSMFKSC